MKKVTVDARAFADAMSKVSKVLKKSAPAAAHIRMCALREKSFP